MALSVFKRIAKSAHCVLRINIWTMVGRLGERPSAWPESRLRPREEKNSECDCQSQLTNTLPYSGCLLHPKYNWNTVDTDSVQTISFLKNLILKIIFSVLASVISNFRPNKFLSDLHLVHKSHLE